MFNCRALPKQFLCLFLTPCSEHLNMFEELEGFHHEDAYIVLCLLLYHQPKHAATTFLLWLLYPSRLSRIVETFLKDVFFSKCRFLIQFFPRHVGVTLSVTQLLHAHSSVVRIFFYPQKRVMLHTKLHLLHLHCSQICHGKYNFYVSLCWATRLMRHQCLGITYSWATRPKCFGELISVKITQKAENHVQRHDSMMIGDY